MRLVDKSDLIGGLLIVGIGGAFLIPALELRFGTTERIGPGFLPTTLAVLTMLLGALLALSALFREGSVDRIGWRPLLLIPAAIALFIVTVAAFGLLPGVFVAVTVAALAEPNFHYDRLFVALGMALAIWAVFSVGLGLPVPVLRSPF